MATVYCLHTTYDVDSHFEQTTMNNYVAYSRKRSFVKPNDSDRYIEK